MDKRRGHHEGSVWFEANQNRWVASVTIAPGKRKRVMCKTKQEAIRVKNELLRKANDGMLPTSEDIKIKNSQTVCPRKQCIQFMASCTWHLKLRFLGDTSRGISVIMSSLQK